MTADRELLELAAKAAGAKWSDYSDRTPDHWQIKHADGVWREWKPLTDDGDALRLLVMMGSKGRVVSLSLGCGSTACEFNYVNHADDPAAATRRAIVVAMAATGESMP